MFQNTFVSLSYSLSQFVIHFFFIMYLTYLYIPKMYLVEKTYTYTRPDDGPVGAETCSRVNTSWKL
jgi:hypothetical protein